MIIRDRKVVAGKGPLRGRGEREGSKARLGGGGGGGLRMAADRPAGKQMQWRGGIQRLTAPVLERGFCLHLCCS